MIDVFQCSQCQAQLDKRSLERVWQVFYDSELNKTHKLVKYKPVVVSYQIGRSRYEKEPDARDLTLLDEIQATAIPDWFPVHRMPDGERKRKDGYDLKGITHLHHFYFRRPLLAYSRLWQKVDDCPDCAFLRFFAQGSNLGFTKM